MQGVLLGEWDSTFRAGIFIFFFLVWGKQCTSPQRCSLMYILSEVFITPILFSIAHKPLSQRIIPISRPTQTHLHSASRLSYRDSDVLEKAMEVKRSELSYRRAAAMYGIPTSTLFVTFEWKAFSKIHAFKSVKLLVPLFERKVERYR